MTLEEVKKLEPEQISLDFYNNNIKTINAKQLDTKSRYLQITCTKRGKKVYLTSDSTSALIACKKPDGFYVLNKCEILEDGTILVELTQQMLAVKGKSIADIILFSNIPEEINISGLLITDDGNGNITVNETNDIIQVLYNSGASILTTMTLNINVLYSIISNSEIESSNEYNALIEGLADLSNISIAENARMENELSRQNEEEKRKSNEEDRTEKVRLAVEKCNTATESAKKATTDANTATTNANIAKTNCEAATTNANTATKRANNAAETCESIIDGSGIVMKENSVIDDSIRNEASTIEESNSVAIGNSVQVISKESAGFGVNNTVGQKGYYIIAISFLQENDVQQSENYIWLSNTNSGVIWDSNGYIWESIIPIECTALNQKIVGSNGEHYTYKGDGQFFTEKDANGKIENLNDSTFDSGFSIGDKFNIIIPDDHFILCGEIKEVVGNRIKYEIDANHYSYFRFTSGNTYEYAPKHTVDCPHVFLTEEELKTRWESQKLDWTSLEDAIGVDDYTFSVPSKPTIGTITVTRAGLASGIENKVAGGFGEASGANNTVAGNFGHAEGQGTTAGYSAHSEGYLTEAIGKQSHAEGNRAIAQGLNSHAEGQESKAMMTNAHAEGGKTTASGHSSHSEGWGTTAEGTSSHSEGENTKAIGDYSHSEGHRTIANGQSSHVEGGGKYNPYGSEKESISYTYKNGISKTLQNVVANGYASHVEGGLNQADGSCSHVEGYGNFVEKTGKTGHAEGWKVYVSGESAHGEGFDNAVEGNNSHVEGYLNQVLSVNSHGEGKNNIINKNGSESHVEGEGNIVNGKHQHVQGIYNSPLGDDYLHIVGNGESNSKRSNAHTLDKDGNAWYKSLSLGGTHDNPKVNLYYDEDNQRFVISVK